MHFSASVQQEVIWDIMRSTSVAPVNQVAIKVQFDNEPLFERTFMHLCMQIEQLRVQIEPMEELTRISQILHDQLVVDYRQSGQDLLCHGETLQEHAVLDLLELIRRNCRDTGKLVAGHQRISVNVFLLHVTIPSIQGDPCSLFWLLNEWINQNKARNGNELDFTYDGLQYIDYSEWQRKNSKRYQAVERADLYRSLPIENFVEHTSNRIEQFHFSFPEFSTGIKSDVLKNGEEAALLYAWNRLLANVSQGNTCEIGYNCNGRKLVDLQGIFGPIERTITFRPSGKPSTLRDEILEIEEFLLGANRDIADFGGGADWFKGVQEHSFSYFDLRTFHSLNALEEIYLNHGLSATGLQLTSVRFTNKLLFFIRYNSSDYTETTIQHIAINLKSILLSLMSYTSGDFTVNPSKDELDVIADCLSGISTHECAPTVLKMINEHAACRPDSVALMHGPHRLSYAELSTQSVRVATCLNRDFGIAAGDVVALNMPRSFNLVIGMLGILQSGAAFLVVDPRWPEDRKRFILDDSGCKLVLDEEFMLAINRKTTSPEESMVLQEKQAGIDGKTNAYLIYTSGTTGNPKGVLIRHESLANYSCWVAHTFKISPQDRTLLFSSLAFDLPFTSFWSCLVTGATLCLHDDDSILDPCKLLEELSSKGITYIKLTPTHFHLLTSALADSQEILESLRLIILGGEQLNEIDISKFWSYYPSVKFANHYGPTEATVGCLAIPFDITTNKVGKFGNIIGKPVGGNRVYILAETDRICSLGEWGEICIAGKSVALGYWNRAEISHQKFPPNPFATLDKHPTIYRTGDRGRLLHNGVVQFGGRLDRQIKINGYRIEPGEVEYHLAKLVEVLNAVVLVVERDNIPTLVACIMVEHPVTSEKIKQRLKEVLPVHMVPDEILIFEEFPIKGHGKIDMRLLHQVVSEKLKSPKVNLEFESRRTLLRRIWKEVLGVEEVDEDANFFELGGDSIKAIRMMAILGQNGFELRIDILFREQTIRKLEPYLTSRKKQSLQDVIVGSYTLTPIQKRLFNQKIDPAQFVQTVTIDIKRIINRHQLDRVINRLMSHHDGLRLRIDIEDGVGHIGGLGQAHVLEEFFFESKHIFEDEFIGRWRSLRDRLSIENGPLVAIGLFQYASSTVCFVIHHLVVDAVSWRILMEDFSLLLANELDGSTNDLPLKTDSYDLWSTTLMDYKERIGRTNQIKYWKEVISHSNNYFELFTDVATHDVREVVRVKLDLEKTVLLQRECNKVYNTETFDLILTSVCLAIREVMHTSDIFLCLEGHGRERLDGKVDVSRTVGWFSTLYPFFLHVCHDCSILDSIITVKEMLRKIPERGIGFGLLKYSGAEPALLNSEPQIRFNYFGEVSRDEVPPPFDFVDRAASESISLSTFPLDIVGRIADGRLEFEVIFNSRLVDQVSPQQLIEEIERKLFEIINACSGGDVKVRKTPSDFDYKGLSIQELESLFE